MFEIKDMPKCLAGWELTGLSPLLALRIETFNSEQIPYMEQVTINKKKLKPNQTKKQHKKPKKHIS